jgi:hypothetical protein
MERKVQPDLLAGALRDKEQDVEVLVELGEVVEVARGAAGVGAEGRRERVVGSAGGQIAANGCADEDEGEEDLDAVVVVHCFAGGGGCAVLADENVE